MLSCALEGRVPNQGWAQGRGLHPPRTRPSLASVAAGLGFTLACQGGCYVVAEPVRTDPPTDCLEFFAGQSADDPIVCGVPKLRGSNHCDQTLTLPARAANQQATAFASGQTVFWSIPEDSVPPGLEVRATGDEHRSYIIQATLGAEPLTITVPVHDD